MSSQTQSIPFCEIVAPENGKVISFLLQASVFLAVFDTQRGRGYAAHFRLSDLQDGKFPQILHKMIAEPKACEVKIVGSKSLSQNLVRHLNSIGITNFKSSIREGAVQVLFSPHDGRVRVEMELSPTPRKVRVLIVDDSKTIRDLLLGIFAHDPVIEVVGSTGKPLEVLGLIDQVKRDVITMDIQMPDMDGCTLVKEVMHIRAQTCAKTAPGGRHGAV